MILMAGMFLLGCAAASVIVPLRVPLVGTGTTPQKCEHICVPRDAEASGELVKHPKGYDVNLLTGWNKSLAEYGAQGWELVDVLPQAVPPCV